MTILQISDIHWTKHHPWEDDFLGMKAKFLTDVKEYVEAGYEIDYIIICGDIAFKGLKEEYSKALEYIGKVCENANCKREDVFVVPGNHDLNRNSDGHEKREMMNAALSFGQNNNCFLDDMILKSADMRKIQFAAFSEYNAFAKNFFCAEKLMGKCLQNDENETVTESDELYYEVELPKKVGDFSVRVKGVNTALNCDGWDYGDNNKDGHKQILPKRAYTLGEEKKQEIRIFIGHHPLEYLTSRTEVEEYIDSHYHIQLFGHVHIQNVEGGNSVRLLSGAFDPPRAKKEGEKEKYLPVYNFIIIEQKDSTHINVTCNSQIWKKNKFIENTEGCFTKEIIVERNVNKWRNTKMKETINPRTVKFEYIKRDDRTSFWNKVDGVSFEPGGNDDYENCLRFLDAVESAGKLGELDKLMR